MADGVDPSGGSTPATDVEPESFAMPPMNIKEIPMWSVGMGIGEMMGERFLENPEWQAVIADLGWTEEQFQEFWGQTIAGLLKETSRMIKQFDDKEDENKSSLSKAVSL